MKNYFVQFIKELRALGPGDNRKFISDRKERAGSYWVLVLEKAARKEITPYEAATLGYSYAKLEELVIEMLAKESNK